MRSAILTATFALAILAAPVPESNSVINMGEHVAEISRSAEPEPFTRKHDSYRRRDAGPEPPSLIHDERSAEPEPFTRKHDSYRTRAPEPEPFPEAEPIYKSNGRSVEDTLVTRSPTLTRPKDPGPQDTKDETENEETSNVETRALRNEGQPHGPKHKGGRSNVETRALRNEGQPHGPKHKGGRSTGKTVDVRENRNTERDAYPDPTTRGGKPGGTAGNRGGRASNK